MTAQAGTLLVAAPPAHPERPYRHLAMFSLLPALADVAERRARSEELRARLLALADLPEVLEMQVWLGEHGNADVALSVLYRRPVDLDRIRIEPRHRSMMAWYVEHFDDGARRDLSFVVDGS